MMYLNSTQYGCLCFICVIAINIISSIHIIYFGSSKLIYIMTLTMNLILYIITPIIYCCGSADICLIMRPIRSIASYLLSICLMIYVFDIKERISTATYLAGIWNGISFAMVTLIIDCLMCSHTFQLYYGYSQSQDLHRFSDINLITNPMYNEQINIVIRPQYSPNIGRTIEIKETIQNSIGCCSICLENMEYNPENREKNKITSLDCGHQFHKNCINVWYGRKPECPNCRNIIIVTM